MKGNQLPLVTFFFRHLAAIAKSQQMKGSLPKIMSAGVKIDHIPPR